MLLSQLVIAAGLAGMALTGPAAGLTTLVGFAVVVAFASATQDIVIDAWRIEAAEVRQQGIMAAAYQWGYRIAMIVDKKVKVGTLKEMLDSEDDKVRAFFSGPRMAAIGARARKGA